MVAAEASGPVCTNRLCVLDPCPARYRCDGRDCGRGILLLSPRPARLCAVAQELLEEHWCYIDRYQSEMIARCPTLGAGEIRS
jgi:hypothetical protein